MAFFEPEFSARTPVERGAAYTALKAAAIAQGFGADVVAVWEDPEGRMRFMAPAERHPFFQVVKYAQLRAQINGSITI